MDQISAPKPSEGESSQVSYTFEEFEGIMRQWALTILDDRSNLRALHLEVDQAVESEVLHSSSEKAATVRDRRLAKGGLTDKPAFVQGLCIRAATRMAANKQEVVSTGSFEKSDYRTWVKENLERLSDEELIKLEYEESKDRDKENVQYVLYEPAVACKERSNDGSGTVERDTGREGWTLVRFLRLPQAQRCQLAIEELAALRLYTMSTFALINNPLRKEPKVKDEYDKHPVALTVYFLHCGLKKLRAMNFGQSVFRPFCTYRPRTRPLHPTTTLYLPNYLCSTTHDACLSSCAQTSGVG